ncbi:hypothetical protein MPTK1_8g15860 [Marchantia polymorpha subsp. ruderalis]|uniref:Uncharacterized protein n=1 Tax=Marchantia polymorpha TaxID=3197 RepID=A0A2R6WKX4_MARPO|nr:hypothetical protein MARPO_0079s0026 [Marchantia polymorpha]BBN20036.1 hypothetical protein Mp_8g15860 [Marchantia polymorpha subsp. ruderalis]|eukprot:PTQ34516.1 hypothetical protein MARPO_0079s0026 [Marchantia polymorpha]
MCTALACASGVCSAAEGKIGFCPQTDGLEASEQSRRASSSRRLLSFKEACKARHLIIQKTVLQSTKPDEPVRPSQRQERARRVQVGWSSKRRTTPASGAEQFSAGRQAIRPMFNPSLQTLHPSISCSELQGLSFSRLDSFLSSTPNLSHLRTP